MRRLEHLQLRFAEEALETGHAMHKLMAFGQDSAHPDRPHQTNAYEVHKELQELLAVKEMIEAEGLNLTFDDGEEIREAKKKRLEKHLGFSLNCGTLIDDANGFYRPGLRCPLNRIFVFGSNLGGRHGAGAAKDAADHHGAIYGHPEGLQGLSYGIPTKDAQLKVLSLERINTYVQQFVTFTRQLPLHFYVTAVGTGLAGYSHAEIAPMFAHAKRCIFPISWQPYLSENHEKQTTDRIAVSPQCESH